MKDLPRPPLLLRAHETLCPHACLINQYGRIGVEATWARSQPLCPWKGHAVLEALAEYARERFREGRRAGWRDFAWWKDGVEYVGTTGTTLREVLERDAPVDWRSCDHKFVDSSCCLKCGWVPPAVEDPHGKAPQS